MKKITLAVKFNLYQVKNDKLYCLLENQDEIWELHAYDIK
jgi:hypothetical protein